MPIWTKNRPVRTPFLLLAAIELLAIYFSVVVSAVGYFGSLADAGSEVGSLHLKAAIVAIVMLLSLIGMGLYNIHQRLNFREILARIMVGLFFGSISLTVIFFAFPTKGLPRTHLALASILALILVIAIRALFLQQVNRNIFRRRTLVYGAGRRAQSINDLRRQADRRGFVVAGYIPADGDYEVCIESNLITDQSLSAVVARESIDEIVIAMDDRRGNLPMRELIACKLSGVNVIDVIEFLERESEKIRIDLVSPGWLIFSPGFRVSRLRKFSGRLFGVLVSALALLAIWPLMLLVVVAIKIEDGVRAPIFYKQDRVGQFGVVFPILKFRSMVTNAETESGAVWAEENDPRVTKVGWFMRKTRIDEIPQLLNVLRGDMSLVGPRPERPEFVEQLAESIPYYLERHTVKPGITGWAQLRYSYGSSTDDAIQKLQYDLYYVKNQSLIMDLTIILQTVEVVIWGIGSR